MMPVGQDWLWPDGSRGRAGWGWCQMAAEACQSNIPLTPHSCLKPPLTSSWQFPSKLNIGQMVLGRQGSIP